MFGLRKNERSEKNNGQNLPVIKSKLGKSASFARTAEAREPIEVGFRKIIFLESKPKHIRLFESATLNRILTRGTLILDTRRDLDIL